MNNYEKFQPAKTHFAKRARSARQDDCPHGKKTAKRSAGMRRGKNKQAERAR